MLGSPALDFAYWFFPEGSLSNIVTRTKTPQGRRCRWHLAFDDPSISLFHPPGTVCKQELSSHPGVARGNCWLLREQKWLLQGTVLPEYTVGQCTQVGPASQAASPKKPSILEQASKRQAAEGRGDSKSQHGHDVHSALSTTRQMLGPA